jgi:hypothetical protein
MRLIIVILIITYSVTVEAQQKIVFTKTETGKTVTVKLNNLLKLSFIGYLKQQQTAEGKVSAITDSSVTLSPRKKIFQKLKGAQTVMLKDVTGFKRYSNFRPAGEIIYGILSVGATGTVTAVIASANVPTALSFLTTAATSTLTLAVRNVFLPNKILIKAGPCSYFLTIKIYFYAIQSNNSRCLCGRTTRRPAKSRCKTPCSH